MMVVARWYCQIVNSSESSAIQVMARGAVKNAKTMFDSADVRNRADEQPSP